MLRLGQHVGNLRLASFPTSALQSCFQGRPIFEGQCEFEQEEWLIQHSLLLRGQNVLDVAVEVVLKYDIWVFSCRSSLGCGII